MEAKEDLPPWSTRHQNHVISTGGLVAQRIWYPDVPILESVHSKLLDKWGSSKNEVCGFIDSEWNIHEIQNIHDYPQRNFFMHEPCAENAIEYIYNQRQAHIIAIWHTHPNDVVWPSPRDIVGWPNPALNWRYLIVTRNDVYEWELTNGI